MISKVYATILAAGVVAQGNEDGSQSVRSNGNVAFTYSKEFIENKQDLFQKYLIKETEEMELRDVRVQQKTDLGRLTSLMSKVRLSEIDLENAHFAIDMKSNGAPGKEVQCETDFEMNLKITGISMVFDFDQWFEVESNYVVEEWGMGSFTVPNMTFTMLAEPYVN